jgi:replicative DNA helicase
MNQMFNPVGSASFRDPPSNHQAELAVLGAIFVNNTVYADLQGILKPEYFVSEVNQKIYAVCERIIENGGLANALTLKSRFSEEGVLANYGGTKYLVEISASVLSTDVKAYAQVVKDAWLRRELIAAGTQLISSSYDGDPDQTAADFLDACSVKLSELGLHDSHVKPTTTILGAVEAALQEAQDAHDGKVPPSVSTGIPSIDKVIMRLRGSSLYLIGGRPGMGKTSLARTIALNAALGMGVTFDGEIIDDPNLGSGVAIFSIEESDPEFGAAALSILTGVTIGDILSGAFLKDNNAAQKIVKAKKRLALSDHNIEFDDNPYQTLRSISLKARAIQRKMQGRLKVIVIDYLQLMKDPPGVKDKRLAVAENIRGIKILAKELGVAIIMLSQVARKVEDTPDKRPTPDALRESGDIEDAADIIMFPFREAYYHGRTRPKRGDDEEDDTYAEQLQVWQQRQDQLKNKAELIVPKVRRGPSPITIDLRFVPEATRFEEAFL